MLKVLKNLKNSWITVLVIVILLCVQAATDLALPDYTSKIVNVGIQYGGIEEAVPELVSKELMENLLIFTEADEQILENYDLVEANPDNHQEKVIKKYLGKEYNVEENNLYVLKDLDEEQLNNLESLLITPLTEYSTITNEQTANQIKEQIKQKLSELANENLENQDEDYTEENLEIYNMPMIQAEEPINIDDISLLDLLKHMPEEQRKTVLDQFTSQISQMSDSLKEQAAISAVKQVYISLGVDTGKLQNDYILMSGLQMLGIALISMICAITIMLCSSRVAAKLGKTLRDKVFKKVLNKDVPEVFDACKNSSKVCGKCRNGYRGRLGIHEVLLINDHIRDALNNTSLKKENLRDMVYTDEVTTMLQDGLEKVVEGYTTFEEIYKLIEIEVDLDNKYGENGTDKPMIKEEEEKEKTNQEENSSD